jgi:hypothetical protein
MIARLDTKLKFNVNTSGLSNLLISLRDLPHRIDNSLKDALDIYLKGVINTFKDNSIKYTAKKIGTYPLGTALLMVRGRSKKTGNIQYEKYIHVYSRSRRKDFGEGHGFPPDNITRWVSGTLAKSLISSSVISGDRVFGSISSACRYFAAIEDKDGTNRMRRRAPLDTIIQDTVFEFKEVVIDYMNIIIKRRLSEAQAISRYSKAERLPGQLRTYERKISRNIATYPKGAEFTALQARVRLLFTQRSK